MLLYTVVNKTLLFITLLRDEQVHTPSVFNIVSSSTSYNYTQR